MQALVIQRQRNWANEYLREKLGKGKLVNFCSYWIPVTLEEVEFLV